MNISDLDINNIGSWPRVIRLMAIGICCATIMILVGWLLIKPELKALEAAEIEEVTLLGTYQEKYAQAANLADYQKQVDKIRSTFRTMLGRLPNESEVHNLIEDISKLGIANGLKFDLIRPEAERRENFIAVLPIKIIVEGRYHQFAEFISDISLLERIVSFEDVIIKRKKPQAATENSLLTNEAGLIMEVTAETYRYIATGDADVNEKN